MVIGCLRLSDVSIICCVINPRRTLQKICGGLLYGVYIPGNEFELFPKMETRNPVKGYFGSKFPAICNHCGVMAA